MIVADVRHDQKPPRTGEVRTWSWFGSTTRGRTATARASMARAILMEPTDFEYGERQYKAEDPAGHRWTFSETLDDVHPETWGGTLVER